MTEEMKIKELLKRRYKVTADYPDSHLRIGDVIVDGQKDYEWWINKRDESKWTFKPENYPAIFRKLEWWEEHKPEEMPEYVKCIKTPDQIIQPGDILKVTWTEIGGKAENGPRVFPYTNCFEPATESEYTAYIEKQPTTLNQGV